MPLRRNYPPMIDERDWNNVIDYIGGETDEPQITTAKIKLAGQDELLSSWQSKLNPSLIDPGVIYGGVGQGGQAAWGNIKGQISDQTDLVAALAAKAALAHTHAASDIVSGLLAIARGGLNNATWTNSQLIRMNAAGTAFESSGKEISDFAATSHHTQHEHGGGDVVTVTDTELSLTDEATKNVSTSKHGFAPKAPNDASKFLDGTGAYSVPPSAPTSVYGSAVCAGDNTIVASSFADLPTNIISITLPTAGVYLIFYSLQCRMDGVTDIVLITEFRNVTDGTDIVETQRSMLVTAITNFGGVLSAISPLSVGASKNLRIYAFRTGSGGTVRVRGTAPWMSTAGYVRIA
jgi:hypothetical protein